MCRLVLVLVLLGVASEARAHETLPAGDFRVQLGWLVEPTYAGVPNAVQVRVLGRDRKPVTDLRSARLTVEVSAGGAVVVRPLAVVDGELRATLIPTRVGRYAFHVSGEVDGRAVDVTSTCSDTTFDCVAARGEVQFPAGEPTNAELAARSARADARARDARKAARTARWLAVGALVVALAAVAVSVAGRRRRP